MAVALALISAVVFGAADFSGGIASRRNGSSFVIVAIGVFVGLAIGLGLALIVPSSTFTGTDALWSVGAGAVGTCGMLAFYRALAGGTMSIVAPVTAVAAAIVPITTGLLTGDRPSTTSLLGIVLGLGALAMFGGGDDRPHHAMSARSALVLALAAGAGFGGWSTFIAQTHHDAGMWPLVTARAMSCAIVTVGLLSSKVSRTVQPNAWLLVVLAGIGEVVANALYLTATRHGALSIVGVVSSLAPAMTIVLARANLHERLLRHQQLALVLAGGALVLISLG
jgi:drug/metabolite transporter (DMT)-like permease